MKIIKIIYYVPYGIDVVDIHVGMPIGNLSFNETIGKITDIIFIDKGKYEITCEIDDYVTEQLLEHPWAAVTISTIFDNGIEYLDENLEILE
jgi:hypothetical protein